VARIVRVGDTYFVAMRALLSNTARMVASMYFTVVSM
jgi:hypothetical protein